MPLFYAQVVRMHIDTAIPCVGYDDFLALTLPRNLAVLDSVTVVTDPQDVATAALATKLGAEVFPTEAWRRGGPLNKAAALNDWISRATTYDPEQWLLVMDADIMLFHPLAKEIPHVDARGLYSLRRRLCESPGLFNDFLAGGIEFSEFPLDLAPVGNGKAWESVPTAKTAALAGYLHLWCPMRAAGRLRYPTTGTAEAYDLGFALSFPEELRNELSCGEVLHLGPTQTNWSGRRSPRWERSA